MWARSCFLLAWAAVMGSAVPMDDENRSSQRVPRSQPIFGITHLDIRDAILALERSIKAVASKLNRHEAREAQLADLTTRTLGNIASDVSDTEGGVQAVARQLAMMEERLLSMEALMQTTDERQRMLLGKLNQGLDKLLAQNPRLEDLPPRPGTPDTQQQETAVLKVVKKLNRKVSGVEVLLQRDMRAVTNEVRSVGESLGQHMSQLQGRHDHLITEVEDTRNQTESSLHQLATSFEASTSALQDQMQQQSGAACSGGVGGEEVTAHLEALDRHARQQEQELNHLKQETQKSLEEHLLTLRTLLRETHTGQALLNVSVANLTKSLNMVNSNTQGGLSRISSEVLEAVKAGAEDVEGTVTALGLELQEGTSNIMDVLDDRASQAENLQHTVLENYSELSAEINSLKKVEQVMIHTADSVLDTKRSIEFGIQQIILELGEIVKSSGSTINTTLSDQINNISFAILKNQTSALTSMKAKMEQEISQVWRQIGIMYQQMTQSVDLLDQLRDTTKKHMNASLSRVGDMDGTVGMINTKVADVESNLNYLLGRLSLVVSEFNLMKSGVGEELMRLRNSLAEENESSVEFGEGGEPTDDSRYEVNRKREVHPYSPQPHPVPQPSHKQPIVAF